MPTVTELDCHLQQYEPDLSVSTAKNIQYIISGIETNEKTVYEQALINFVAKENQKFDIDELKEGHQREKLWNALVKLATSTDDNDILAVTFTVFRIISRDKGSVNKLVTQQWLDLLLFHTGLNDNTFDYSDDTLCKIEEGQKVLWNTLFNSKEQVESSLDNGLYDKLIHRIGLYDKAHVPDTIKFYDMKFIFLMSALSTTIRKKLDESDGVTLLIKVLKVILIEASKSPTHSPQSPPVLDDSKADIGCETLKALFNVTLNCSVEDGKVAQYQELVRLLRNYLLTSTASLEKTWRLRNDIVNLLTNIPSICYTELITPVEESTPLPKTLNFENQNMIVIHEILMFLEAKFKDETSVGRQLEIYSPILCFLLKGATIHRSIRKYLRMHILPPLKDIDKRPEDADTLRGHLCKLLTSPITQIRDLAAELLFVLCKCNVSRMIKYTGFGNAAGLLAQKGLLGGKKDAAEADYSSQSEGSETEEYSEQKHLINPVLGCVEQPHADPMQGMTDEQKEYEALKLVERIDSISKSGIVQPCRVGADGKLHPIEYVLQLQEGIKSQHISNDDSDSG